MLVDFLFASPELATNNMNTAQLFFLHIPKTAGMSLRNFLLDQYNKEEILEKYDWQSLTLEDITSLANYRLLMGHFDYRMLQFLPPTCKTATFLREPIARTVSAIEHAIRDANFRPSQVNLEGNTLKDIIRDPEKMRWFVNTQVWLLSANSPQETILAQYAQRNTTADYLPFLDNTKLDLDSARIHLEQFDFVGIAENFYQGLLQLSDVCGFYPPHSPPLLNQKPQSQSTQLDAEDRAILAECNALDIELYQHALRLNLNHPRVKRDDCAERYFSMRPPISADAHINMSPPFRGWGFYELERDAESNRTYRWSGPFNDSGIDLKLARGAYRIKTHYYLDKERTAQYVDILVNERNVGILVNQRSLETRAWEEDGCHYCEFFLRILADDEIIELRFNTDKTVSPSTWGDTDLRELGFQLLGVSITRNETATTE